MGFTLGILGISFLAGLFGAMLGIGGGIFIVPGLTLLLHLPIHAAIGSSITAVIATSSAATLSYIRRDYVNVRLGMLLQLPTVVGAVAGGLLAVRTRGEILQGIFALVLIYSAYSMARPHSEAAEIESGETGGWLASGFLEPTNGDRVEYVPRRKWLGMVISSAAGAMSGLLGVGGGFIQVPMMTRIMSVPARAAMATSAYQIGLTGAASAFIYYSHGYAVPEVAGPAAVGVLLGAKVGTRVFRKLRPRTLMLMFAALLVLAAIRLVLEALR